MDIYFVLCIRKEISKIEWYKFFELFVFWCKGVVDDVGNLNINNINVNKFYMVVFFFVLFKKWVFM